jgi:hypothetical protein
MQEWEKPKATSHPVSDACPQCGSRAYTEVKSEAIIAVGNDRVCAKCSTRYTPPTPWWARPIFAVIGLAMSVIGVLAIYEYATKDVKFSFAIFALPFGLGCLYKAVSK